MVQVIVYDDSDGLWTLRDYNFGTRHLGTFKNGHFETFGSDTSGLLLWILRDSPTSILDTSGLFKMVTSGLFFMDTSGLHNFGLDSFRLFKVDN